MRIELDGTLRIVVCADGDALMQHLTRIEARLISFERKTVEDFSALQKTLDDLKTEAARNTGILQRLVDAVQSGNQAAIDAATAEATDVLSGLKSADDAAEGALGATGPAA